MIWLYLDDERGLPINRDVLVPDHTSMINLINVFESNHLPFAIDFDYDIDDDFFNGAFIAKYIVNHRIGMVGFAIHSSNSAGAEQIRNILINGGYTELRD